MKRVTALLGVAAYLALAGLLLGCEGPPPPEGLIVVPEGTPGSAARASLHVRVGHGVVVRLPWGVQSASGDPEGLAAAVVRGRDVWLVGQESGAVTFDVQGPRDTQRATLEVSVDLRAPVDAEPPGGGLATPGVIEVPKGPHASTRWTLGRGHGSIVRPGFSLKRILVGDPGV